MSAIKLTRAALFAALFAAIPAIASPQVFIGIGINIGPPPIPVYTQPYAPAPNYIWQPGYWQWGPGGYFWVPGTWVAAPAVGLLWTPGYWGWNNGAYFWNAGYWGPTVGFYGGINYGFGYYGTGYVGGRWYGNSFHYNTAITRVNTTVIHNTYVDKTVIYHGTNRTSFNGGHGGIQAHPTQAQISSRQHGTAPTTQQHMHAEMSSQNRNHLSTVNRGHPTTAAVSHPYSHNNPPRNPAPITNADRQAAQQHVAQPHGNGNGNVSHGGGHGGKPPR